MLAACSEKGLLSFFTEMMEPLSASFAGSLLSSAIYNESMDLASAHLHQLAAYKNANGIVQLCYHARMEL